MRRLGLSCWLLLLSIFAHALIPAGSPLQLSKGSAFSASTADVSVMPARQPLSAMQPEPSRADGSAPGGDGDADPAVPVLPATLSLPLPPGHLGTHSRTAATGGVPAGAVSLDARAPPTL